MNSPLFGVRTQSAISSNKDVLTTENYVGQGEKSNILQVLINNKMDVSEVFYRLKNMNNLDFSKFVSTVISKLLEGNLIDKKDISEAINILNYARENPEILNQDNLYTAVHDCTFAGLCPTGPARPELECKIIFVIKLIVLSPLIAIMILASLMLFCWLGA